jgi:hypothetical protein
VTHRRVPTADSRFAAQVEVRRGITRPRIHAPEIPRCLVVPRDSKSRRAWDAGVVVRSPPYASGGSMGCSRGMRRWVGSDTYMQGKETRRLRGPGLFPWSAAQAFPWRPRGPLRSPRIRVELFGKDNPDGWGPPVSPIESWPTHMGGSCSLGPTSQWPKQKKRGKRLAWAARDCSGSGLGRGKRKRKWAAVRNLGRIRFNLCSSLFISILFSISSLQHSIQIQISYFEVQIPSIKIRSNLWI